MDLELLEKICQQYHLGALRQRPLKLQGGFLHKMYALFTVKGRYAVKLLNPFIMQRESAMENYRIAEKLELLLEEKGIPIIPALIFENKKMQHLEGHFFYLYKWYDGKALRSEEIKEMHCRKIGQLLACIHKLDRHKEPYSRGEIHIEWENYIEQLAKSQRPHSIRQMDTKTLISNASAPLIARGKKEIHKLLAENLSLLYEIQNNGNIAIKKIPPVISVCHNDMDVKNVLWAGMDCQIIDLECLNYASPFIELYELALCWSGYERCQMDYNLFCCFLRSYAEAGGELQADWETIYWSNYGRLEWLEYNVKRSLGIECSEEEIAMGISEVKKTIAHVVYYHNIQQDILRNCRTIL